VGSLWVRKATLPVAKAKRTGVAVAPDPLPATTYVHRRLRSSRRSRNCHVPRAIEVQVPSGTWQSALLSNDSMKKITLRRLDSLYSAYDSIRNTT